MRFDTLLHLSCEHALPIYRAACQVTASRHIVAVAHEHGVMYDGLQRCFADHGHLEKVNVRSNDPDGYAGRLMKVLEGLPPGRHAVHLVGASQTVFTTLLLYCREKGIPCFFPDLATRAFRWSGTGADEPEPLVPVFKTVSDVFQLAGYSLDADRARASWEQAMRNEAVTRVAWSHRSQIQTFSRTVHEFSKKPGQPFRIEPQSIDGLTMAATLKKRKDGNKGMLTLGEEKFTVRPWADMAFYLCGGWYRDAVLQTLINQKKQGAVVDIQVDFELTSETPPPGMPHRYHVDIAYTDGIQLVLLQTLFRQPERHHLRNLRDAVQGMAHDAGQGILCSPEASPQVEEAAIGWPEIHTFLGPECMAHPEQLVVTGP